MTLRLFADDLVFLRAAYPAGGYNRIVRALVSRHVRLLRNRAIEKVGERLSDEELASV